MSCLSNQTYVPLYDVERTVESIHKHAHIVEIYFAVGGTKKNKKMQKLKVALIVIIYMHFLSVFRADMENN